MSKTLRNRIIAIGIVLAIAVGIFFMHWSTRVHKYKDETITGNTSTNLLNGGFFAKSDNKIYFANPYDQNSLYVMRDDLSHVKKLYQDYVSYLNVAGDYIFYTRRNDKKGSSANVFLSLSSTGLYRLTTDGGAIGQLYKEPTMTANLLGNKVYYQHYDQEEGLQLFSIDIDGKNDTMLSEEGGSPTVILDNTIYYTGMDEDHNIHSISTAGGSARVVCEGNFTSLSYADGYLYCLDMANDYTLCRLKPNGSELEHLTQERIATYNISPDGTIYVQIDNGADNGLYAIDAGSNTHQLLKAGNFNYFHIIDNHLFFEKYDGSAAYVMNTRTEEIKDFKP